jgi:hypothetical protein
MNPPYDKNKHLKFLEKDIQLSDIVVSIQPCEFLIKTQLKPSYKTLKDKYKNSIGKHLNDLEVLRYNPFDALIDFGLGIYKCTKNGGFDYENYYKKYSKKYLNAETLFNTGTVFNDKIEKYSSQKYFVPLRPDGNDTRWWTLQLINYLDIIVDGKVYSGDYKGLTIPEARMKNPHENPRNAYRQTIGIAFDTLNEAINFRDSLKTEAFMFVIALLKTTRKNPFNKIPLLNDYSKHVSNDDIFDMFNIDKSLRSDIIKELQPFTHKTTLSGVQTQKLLIQLQNKYSNILYDTWNQSAI